jgi:predicted MFS family arabinose efflux permease
LVHAGGDFGWRLVFYVTVPVGIVLVFLALRYLPTADRGPKPSLDPVGVLLFGTATLLILLPLVGGSGGSALSQRPWWLLGVSAVLIVLFLLWERYWTATGKETLLDLSLVKVRSYVLGLGLGTFYFAGFTSIFIVLTLYLQQGLHYTAFQAGLSQVPFAVGSATSAWIGGRLVSRYGRGLVVTGLVAITLALVAIDLLVPRLDGDVGLKLAPLFLLAGLGGGPGHLAEHHAVARRGRPGQGRCRRWPAADRAAGRLGDRGRGRPGAVLRAGRLDRRGLRRGTVVQPARHDRLRPRGARHGPGRPAAPRAVDRTGELGKACAGRGVTR